MGTSYHIHIASDEKLDGREHFTSLVPMQNWYGYKSSQVNSCVIEVSFPDLTQHVYCFKYNVCVILKVICDRVGLGLGPRLVLQFVTPLLSIPHA